MDNVGFEESGLDPKLEEVLIDSKSIQVVLKYPVNTKDIVIRELTQDPIREYTLHDVFYNLGIKFNNTWNYEDKTTIKFGIVGMDEDCILGSFGPRYRKKKQ